MVHLLDLPDELLIQICGAFPQADISDIKSCRLSCQRLCAASSHLLVPLVAVDCRKASLERFTKILHHPTISRGVRIVRVPIHSYRHELSDLCASFVKFVVEPALHARAAHDHHRRAALCFFRRYLDGHGDGNPLEHDDSLWLRALRLVHGEYQRLYREQEALRSEGTFVDTVASAVATMPRGTVLIYDDKPCSTLDAASLQVLVREHCRLLGLDPSAWRPIWYEMLSPTTWTDLVRDDFGWEAFAPDPAFQEPQMDFILELPGAIARAGGQVHDMRFDLSCETPLRHLGSGVATRSHLASATQQLQAFTLISHQPQTETLSHDYASSVLARTPNLGFLRLDIASPGSHPDILVSRLWPRLQNIHLAGVQLTLPDLVTFLDGLPAYVKNMRLSSVHLMQGSWADALEALRQKSYGSFTVEDPRGSEAEHVGVAFETGGNGPGDRFVKRVRVPGGLSPAEAFVRRVTDTNPCQS
ncbi:uncharacterized protein PODANS_5_7095 [Podospora anserina S mat+]|uniref:Podospora anserina S mat+ genomic DNA chromosome 5, supercontig 8 n=1 Tax=Podospora anserina (strain S / ATCC MYA-4624 / DSM 980 / FGSC 10383) TaxID=515849 RepID=B2AMD9_PODAN|nr:uncharacterized protein PODANS_5_7095 [Podospora anserina S mat+]CAP65133.1 unnamed protein product [Podospora anserina S mat+]CDP29778.1 Putative protein of unknown function [Podospora anserina S mat+]